MNLRSLFSSPRTARRFQSRHAAAARAITVVAPERLENRALLAGNVTAQLIGQTAFVNGDAADNSVEVIIDAGNVVVRGIDGTTINGAAGDFIVASNSSEITGSLVASFSGGNNTFAVNGITVGRDIVVSGGHGNDTMTVQSTTVGRHLWMSGAQGNDILGASNVTTVGSLYISGGAGNDDIVIDASTIGVDTRIDGLGGDDDIVVRNSTLSDDLTIAGHSGHDVIMLDGARVGDKTWLRGGSGADNMIVQGNSQFYDRVRAFGGSGGDNFEAVAGVIFDGLRRRSFSGFVADTTTIDTRINDTTTGAIALFEAVVTAANPTLTITATQTSVNETAGTIANALTVTRTGNITEELVVTLTSANTAKLTVAPTLTIPAGATSATTNLVLVNTPTTEGQVVVTVTASATDLNSGTVAITIDDTLTVTSAISSPVEQSNGIDVTREETVTITGVTAPGAVVTLDRDGDDLFDDGTATADATGNYSVTTTLLNNATNLGENSFTVRSTAGTGAAAQTSESSLDVHYSPGRVVRFTTNQDFDNDGAVDFFDIEMLDADAEATVDNFLSYTTTAATGTERFDNLLLQRTDDNFIIQGGRFNVNGSAISEVDRDADNDGQSDLINGEFLAANSNVRGTLSMALPAGNPNGGSSEWFLNVVDNSTFPTGGGLDAAEHTVFGRVIGDGMGVVDAMNLVTPANASALYSRTSLGANAGALGELPLRNGLPTGTALTGTVSLPIGSDVLTGVATAFTTQLSAGESIDFGGRIFIVESVQSDTSATLTEVGTSSATASNVSALIGVLPDADDFLVFTNIGEILDSI